MRPMNSSYFILLFDSDEILFLSLIELASTFMGCRRCKLQDCRLCPSKNGRGC